ncbi:hypothetical protein D8Y22_06890 [Salinadaptatus halalkaliphilus]|uniref:Uncharacterized protein n=1 Tax=Salinadaptatus halalkaliphilus TaxID=2419781 RepID=A0A4S3TMY9_9EURY|nr:hypothetical protein [Salinadaptatus halalkaliphilus]THE65536.1 hypothetical protein D8Y22_06890 [Salinadaptatus halalkaliphilus]
MPDSRLTRRSMLAVTMAAIAGCTSGGDDPEELPPDAETGGDESERDADEREIPDRDIDADWDAAAPFRTWLLDSDPVSGGNRRFDYTAVFPEGVDLEPVLPGFSDVTIDDVDGHLVQAFTQVFFGTFDVDAITADADRDDDTEITGTYGGYTVVTESLPDGERTLAIGPEAIVIGDDYEARIDAHQGERDRLEDVDPEFTHLFQQLPHTETVTGEYDAPAGSNVDIDEIYLWGVSSESPMAEEMTWVFVFESADALTDDALETLEAVSSDVASAERDGRTATIVGTPPAMPEDAPGATDGT